MYINLHQNRVSIDQSKPCTQSYLQKNRKLHNYATYNSNFKTKLFSDMHHRITYLHINFQQNRVSRFVKTVHTNLFAIRISKNQAFRTCTTPSRTFRPILRSIGLLDNELPRKENISTDDRRTDRRTDGQTDGRTDGQTSRTTTIGSFFEKRKNY